MQAYASLVLWAATAFAVVGLATAFLSPSAAHAQAARQVEPVILTGADVSSWSGPAASVTCQPSSLINDRDAHNDIVTVPAPSPTAADPNEIAAYKWEGGAFVEIPVQVDEMYPFCLSNPNSNPGVGFGQYSGTDKELTYAWDDRGLSPARHGAETWRKTDGVCAGEFVDSISAVPDPVPTLDNDDEIVFMASDAGDLAPPLTPFPAGVTSMQAVALLDPLNPASIVYVYLALQPGGSSFDVTNGYVSYVRDADADEWIDRYSIARDDPEVLGVSNTTYGPNLPGDVCRTAACPSSPATLAGECGGGPSDPDFTQRGSSDRFVRDGATITTPTYEVYVSGRWMFRDFKIAKPGMPGVYGPDLIDRWKGRAFQQSPDSSISLVGFEDEQVNWEANAALLGELAGPVRAIRELWGADSGTNVTKTEAFYRDLVTHRYHVRVHPIPPDGLYTSWDYNHDVVSAYYNTIQPGGVAIDGCNDDVGNVDGVFGFPAFFDAPDPTFSAPSAILNWEQVAGSGDAGSLVYIVEIKGATSAENPAVVPYYRDDACLDDGTGDNPPPRFWPGEDSGDGRVQRAYCAENGESPGCDLSCPVQSEATCAADVQGIKVSGVWGAHGVHYFVTGDTDNNLSPETLNEIDAQQWQFAVPMAAPTNVGQEYGNVVIAPLQLTAIDITAGGAVNTPPVASSTTATTDQDTPVDIDLGGADLDDCELSFHIDTPPSNGSVSTPADQACTTGTPNTDAAEVTYTPDTGFSGLDTFTFFVNDGEQDSGPATVTVGVNSQTPPPNAPPSAAPTSASTDEGVPVSVDLSGTDLETCELTFSIVDPPSGGSLDPIVDAACTLGVPNTDAATVTYNPIGAFSGLDTFTYQVHDGADASAPATAVITVAASGAPTNTAPNAGDTSATAEYETAVDVALGGLDLEDCELTFSIVDPPANGSLGAIVDAACNAGLPNNDSAAVTYTPAGGFSGGDSFTYKVNDGAEDSVPATATITVKEEVVEATCGSVPEAPGACTASSDPTKSALLLKDRRISGNPDQARFRWRKGSIDVADFGDPLNTTSYEFCVYTEARGLVVARHFAPGGTCEKGRPCWKSNKRGFKYRTSDSTPADHRARSFAQLKLKSGGNGRGKVDVKRIGNFFPLQFLPADMPVIAQVKNSEGECWQTRFDAPAKKNDTTRFSDSGNN